MLQVILLNENLKAIIFLTWTISIMNFRFRQYFPLV